MVVYVFLQGNFDSTQIHLSLGSKKEKRHEHGHGGPMVTHPSKLCCKYSSSWTSPFLFKFDLILNHKLHPPIEGQTLSCTTLVPHPNTPRLSQHIPGKHHPQSLAPNSRTPRTHKPHRFYRRSDGLSERTLDHLWDDPQPAQLKCMLGWFPWTIWCLHRASGGTLGHPREHWAPNQGNNPSFGIAPCQVKNHEYFISTNPWP
jgi:hypothetical protein